MPYLKRADIVTALFYTFLVALVMVSPAMADKGEKPAAFEIQEKDRLVLQGHLGEWYDRNCTDDSPAPACKDSDGKASYDEGKILPAGVVYSTLPRSVAKQMEPVPADHKYVRVDRDVYLINASTRRVVDSVTLLALEK